MKNKIFDSKSIFYRMVEYADDTKGISWLGTQILSDYVDGLAYGFLALVNSQNIEDGERLNWIYNN